ncbi:MAG: hypothetical protein ANABAC_3454 [Anaerolineae bacterium]|nr:MAG: hypothetical protein ANABAC_3454 [Anaerolineae bacterium]
MLDILELTCFLKTFIILLFILALISLANPYPENHYPLFRIDLDKESEENQNNQDSDS